MTSDHLAPSAAAWCPISNRLLTIITCCLLPVTCFQLNIQLLESPIPTPAAAPAAAPARHKKRQVAISREPSVVS